MKELIWNRNIETYTKIEESKIVSVNKFDNTCSSFRVYEDGFAGIHKQSGYIDEEKGFAKAKENLIRKRPYSFTQEKGSRFRDKTERRITDKELMDISKECIDYLKVKYPRFIFSGSVSQRYTEDHMWGEQGLDYTNIDCCVSIGITFKHINSKDITDGVFNMSLRDFDINIFKKMADDYLVNFENEVSLPEEVIINSQYYGYTGMFSHLDAQSIALGSSLFAGKIGQKVFSEKLSLSNNVTDEDCWFSPFWDGEGCTIPGDKQLFIDKGVILSGYANKRIADKYNVKHTGFCGFDYSDVPTNAYITNWIEKSDKTIKELLNGSLCVVPVMACGGGFNEKGDYALPCQTAYLCDGEHVLGKLPPFTIKTNFFDMFGKDYIGVGCDKTIFNDKSILFKVTIDKI